MADIYDRLIAKYGVENQVKKTISELKELIFELDQYPNGKLFKQENTKDELIDAMHMLRQMVRIFFVSDTEFTISMNEKQQAIKEKYL